MSYSVLLIGLGQIAMGYDLGSVNDRVVSTHARAFATHEAFTLVGAVDPDLNKRGVFEQVYSRPAYCDVAEALASTHADVVVIAVPTQLHGQVLSAVLDLASPRVILCEKPLSYALDEARQMVKLCEAKSCALYVGYPRRSAPGSRGVRERLQSGAIAGPLKGVAWYSKGLLHNGSHFVNLAEYWLGPISDFAIIAAGACRDDGDPEPDVRIAFEDGVVSFFAAREDDYSLHEIDLVASNGRLRYARGGESILWQPAVADGYFAGYKVLSDGGEVIPTDVERTQWHVADQVARSLRGEGADLCSGRDALLTLDWLIKIRDAL